jgi:hypothetical protein
LPSKAEGFTVFRDITESARSVFSNVIFCT